MLGRCCCHREVKRNCKSQLVLRSVPRNMFSETSRSLDIPGLVFWQCSIHLFLFFQTNSVRVREKERERENLSNRTTTLRGAITTLTEVSVNYSPALFCLRCSSKNIKHSESDLIIPPCFFELWLLVIVIDCVTLEPRYKYGDGHN